MIPPFTSAQMQPSQQQPISNIQIVNIVPGASKPDSGIFYDPSTVSIPVGNTIIWKNNDSQRHTVIFIGLDGKPSGEYQSGIILPGQTRSHTFASAGDYHYYCEIYPFMIGEVIVK